MAALLVVGSNRCVPVVLPRNDFQARSRRFLRRGLFLSGALHLALLFVFLSLSGHGDEHAIRLIDTPVDVFRQPLPPVPLPPNQPPARTHQPPRPGHERIEPVFELPRIHVPNAFPGMNGDERTTGDPSRRPGPGPDDNRPMKIDENHVYRVGDVQVAPVPTYSPKPEYPSYALEAGMTGRVVLHVVVGADGTVKHVEPVEGSRIFLEAAQKALHRWRFKPALMNGKPVSVVMEIPVVFRF